MPHVPPLWEEVDPQIPTAVPNPSTVTLPEENGLTTHPWVDVPPFNVIERPTPVIHKVKATIKITISLAVVASLIVGYAVKLKIGAVGIWSFGMYGLLLTLGEYSSRFYSESSHRRRFFRLRRSGNSGFR